MIGSDQAFISASLRTRAKCQNGMNGEHTFTAERQFERRLRVLAGAGASRAAILFTDPIRLSRNSFCSFQFFQSTRWNVSSSKLSV
jgi:hypothetical protein